MYKGINKGQEIQCCPKVIELNWYIVCVCVCEAAAVPVYIDNIVMSNIVLSDTT